MIRTEREIRSRLTKLRNEVRAREATYSDEIRRLWREDVAEAVAAGRIEVDSSGNAMVRADWHGPKEQAFEAEFRRNVPLIKAQINALEWVTSAQEAARK